jgi:hypothetical protein
MDNKFIISKLSEQILNINNIDLQVWLDTTQTYLEDHFKKYSKQANDFSHLIIDFRIIKIGDEDGAKSNNFYVIRKRAIEYLLHLIKYVEEQDQLELINEQNENKKQQVMAKHLNKFDEFTGSSSSNQDSPKTNSKSDQGKRKLPMNLTTELFWTIFSAIILGAFFLGFYIGQAKFDKEKIDLYNQNSELKKDTMRLHSQIKFLIFEKNKVLKK